MQMWWLKVFIYNRLLSYYIYCFDFLEISFFLVQQKYLEKEISGLTAKVTEKEYEPT